MGLGHTAAPISTTHGATNQATCSVSTSGHEAAEATPTQDMKIEAFEKHSLTCAGLPQATGLAVLGLHSALAFCRELT